MTTLFVFSHNPRRPAMVKYSGTRFQFCTKAAIYPWFLGRVGFKSHSGTNFSYTLPYYYLRLPGTYPSLRDENNLEAWIPIGQTSVE